MIFLFWFKLLLSGWSTVAFEIEFSIVWNLVLKAEFFNLRQLHIHFELADIYIYMCIY
jgi:hypothetical protein